MGQFFYFALKSAAARPVSWHFFRLRKELEKIFNKFPKNYKKPLA